MKMSIEFGKPYWTVFVPHVVDGKRLSYKQRRELSDKTRNLMKTYGYDHKKKASAVAVQERVLEVTGIKMEIGEATPMIF